MARFSNGDEVLPLHQNIARELLKWIDNNRIKQRPIAYSILGYAVSYNPQGLGPFLGALSTKCHEHKLPLISAIVVHKHTSSPATQFWEMAERIGRAGINIENEQERVFQQEDWQSLKDILEID